MSVPDRRALVDRGPRAPSIRKQCTLLCLACQFASNCDPLFASNRDPCGVMDGLIRVVHRRAPRP